MATYDYDLCVIGGGAAGLTAASGAARLGARVLLVEAGPALGGDCLHHGCVPSKTLLATARARRLMGRAQAFGLPGLALPPVDFGPVADRIRRVVAHVQKHDSPERFASLGVEVAFGRAVFTDDHTVAVDARRVSAARFVLATGSSPALPDVPGLAQSGCLTNRRLFRLAELPDRLVILGGGSVAVEMAQAFTLLGSRVAVVQRSARLLTAWDDDMALAAQNGLAALGVTLHLETRLTEVTGRAGAMRVRFVDAAGRACVLEADQVLCATGRRPNVEGLGLDAAGVAHDPAGVRVDTRLRTSRRHIFAAGDVLGRHLTTHAAGYEAGVAVAGAVLRLPVHARYRLMPRAVYCDPELAGLGLSERDARNAGLDYDLVEKPFAANDRAVTEEAGEGAIKLLLDGRGRPLGVWMRGPRAGDLLAQWPGVLGGAAKLSTLARAVLPYPTLAEIGKSVAGEALAPRVFGSLPVRLLRRLWGLRGLGGA